MYVQNNNNWLMYGKIIKWMKNDWTNQSMWMHRVIFTTLQCINMHTLVSLSIWCLYGGRVDREGDTIYVCMCARLLAWLFVYLSICLLECLSSNVIGACAFQLYSVLARVWQLNTIVGQIATPLSLENRLAFSLVRFLSKQWNYNFSDR